MKLAIPRRLNKHFYRVEYVTDPTVPFAFKIIRASTNTTLYEHLFFRWKFRLCSSDFSSYIFSDFCMFTYICFLVISNFYFISILLLISLIKFQFFNFSSCCIWNIFSQDRYDVGRTRVWGWIFSICHQIGFIECVWIRWEPAQFFPPEARLVHYAHLLSAFWFDGPRSNEESRRCSSFCHGSGKRRQCSRNFPAQQQRHG